jgi:hypothetical protein
MRHTAKGHHRVRQNDFRHVIQFQQVEHKGSRADLQEQCGGKDAGVTMKKMEAPIFPRIGERFVPSINDRAIKLHPLKKIVVDIVRALADLKMAISSMTQKVAAKFRTRGGTDSACTHKQLTQSKKRQQRQNVCLSQRSGTPDEVIFVATKCRTGIVIDIITDEADLVRKAQVFDRLQ